MFRIAICDDDKNICNELRDIFNNINILYEAGVEIKIFYSGEDLCKFINMSEKDFDIIFLDIDFKDLLTGVEIGDIIKNTYFKEHIKIVYVSSHEQYALDIIKKVRPFDFIVKPFNANTVKVTISRILEILNRQNKPFVYKTNNNYFTMELYKILYFSSRGKMLEIVTHNDLSNVTFRGKISEAEEQLSGYGFFRANKSYLVNYHNVSEFMPDKIKLINGKILYISRVFKPKVREMHLNKIGER